VNLLYLGAARVRSTARPPIVGEVDTIPPESVAGLAITAATTSSLSGTITAHTNSAGDLSDITIIYSTTNPVTVANGIVGDILGPEETSWSITGLSAGTTYYVNAYATDASRNSSALTTQVSQATSTPAPSVPAAPTGLTATANVGSNALAWVDNSDNEDEYTVHRGTSTPLTPDDNNRIAVLGPSISAYADTTAISGTLYYYKVQAKNAGGSTPSNEASCTTQSPAQASPYYSTSFETGSLSGDSGGGFNWTSPGNNPVPVNTDGIANTGSYSLRFRHGPRTPCDDSTAEIRFTLFATPLTELWMEYYIYYPDGTEIKRSGTGSVSASGTTFTASAPLFHYNGSNSHDGGDIIVIAGAGVAGADLTTTISSVSSSTVCVLADAASTTVSGAATQIKLHAYYHRFPARKVGGVCQPGTLSVAGNNKFLVLWPEVYDPNVGPQFGFETRPIDADPTSALGQDTEGDSYLRVLWDSVDTEPAAVGIGQIDPFIDDSSPVAIHRGEWTRIRHHISVASAPDVFDGVCRLWIGENLRLNAVHAAGVLAPSPNYIRKGNFQGFANSGFTNNTCIYMDDLKCFNQNPGW
jgi:hypothetical protein